VAAILSTEVCLDRVGAPGRGNTLVTGPGRSRQTPASRPPLLTRTWGLLARPLGPTKVDIRRGMPHHGCERTYNAVNMHERLTICVRAEF